MIIEDIQQRAVVPNTNNDLVLRIPWEDDEGIIEVIDQVIVAWIVEYAYDEHRGVISDAHGHPVTTEPPWGEESSYVVNTKTGAWFNKHNDERGTDADTEIPVSWKNDMDRAEQKRELARKKEQA